MRVYNLLIRAICSTVGLAHGRTLTRRRHPVAPSLEPGRSISPGEADAAGLQKLHRLAHRYMSFENPGHTLQTTALVNEAYLRLVSNKASW
jgi:hypothetical protein